MSEARRDALLALQQLGDATPAPPASDAEADEVLTRAAELLAAREGPLRELAAALEREPGALRELPEAAALYDTIQERAAAWHAALGRARHLVGERIQAVARLRGSIHR